MFTFRYSKLDINNYMEDDKLMNAIRLLKLRKKEAYNIRKKLGIHKVKHHTDKEYIDKQIIET